MAIVELQINDSNLHTFKTLIDNLKEGIVESFEIKKNQKYNDENNYPQSVEETRPRFPKVGIDISKDQIDLALPKIKVGLDKYNQIQQNFSIVNVYFDRDFQKQFNGFYRVRRNSIWQEKFYKIFEEQRENKNISFEMILNLIHSETNTIEASFTSKLIATINPNFPVLDKFVLENVGLKLPYQKAKNRVNKIVDIYNELNKILTEFQNTTNGQYLISRFKQEYPHYSINETKMVDLVLWQIR